METISRYGAVLTILFVLINRVDSEVLLETRSQDNSVLFLQSHLEATFSVRLDQPPSTPLLQVSIRAQCDGIYYFSSCLLSYNRSNWGVSQKVSVYSVNSSQSLTTGGCYLHLVPLKNAAKPVQLYILRFFPRSNCQLSSFHSGTSPKLMPFNVLAQPNPPTEWTYLQDLDSLEGVYYLTRSLAVDWSIQVQISKRFDSKTNSGSYFPTALAFGKFYKNISLFNFVFAARNVSSNCNSPGFYISCIAKPLPAPMRTSHKAQHSKLHSGSVVLLDNLSGTAVELTVVCDAFNFCYFENIYVELFYDWMENVAGLCGHFPPKPSPPNQYFTMNDFEPTPDLQSFVTSTKVPPEDNAFVRSIGPFPQIPIIHRKTLPQYPVYQNTCHRNSNLT